MSKPEFDYIDEAFKTLSLEMHDFDRHMLHAAIGIATESGELLDALKKSIFYGRELDRTNLIEEMGDLFWYCAIMCHQLGVSFEDVQQVNIAKLRKRYGGAFTSEAAINRDLEAERQILEDGS